ncbi:propanediol/glycerol family dehydratase large subunit [Alicyclobacillus acidoterrestris]|uniref:Propanediol/glycerol family dehydratase large subunit n=1 Tax=Alicyclobacillus acidoterrestris (strain ATCC 49025 / DSM 3922 / CIP 106132 / NCIMB 13137 / GD3B) TaxID=1356854 RepID=T0DSY7_ALIAG|nr:propanediol/glycerol family dehydratase large subunit [Alicyclobacillus acidoterrestris]EPZ52561.1 propanediol dehydratase large subunit [Alicyclobacillus acidoterrestris ATCC 49025]UNO47286.1 propanediol/glycerol family dehydratase large subunit [Alicyclobacillus acidoterrestris]
MQTVKRSKRYEILDKRPVNQDGFVVEWPEQGFIAMSSPADPKPSIKVENGRIVELDGKPREAFDMLDQFLADYTIDTTVAEQVMAMDSVEIARKLVDVNVPRQQVLDITKGMTPAKVVEVLNHMNVVELMMAMQKMRARKTPSNQCHVTNVRDNPVLMAADAVHAGLLGFDEQETTVGVVRYAPFNALALLVGSQTARGGILTQDALEEATELRLAMLGLTSYAETISIYGTESVFMDGDDTPWSKSFLASAYASRGAKMRFTSGSGSEVQMAGAEGKSMLYLEVRCVMMAKGAGVQGLQNGSISCIGVPAAVPSGLRAVAAENLATMMFDLEVASGNDQTFSHSPFRNTAKMLCQMLPGTDFIFSGYSAMPNGDDMFAGSTFDSSDLDDYLIIQRDLMVDGGLRPVDEETVIKGRYQAAKALQAVFEELDFPPITDEEVEAATYGNGSEDMPQRNVVEDLKAAERILRDEITGLDIAIILAKRGFRETAERIFNLLKQRVAGDYLHTSAIINKDNQVISAVNDVNDYRGPGSGYRLSKERWEEIKNIRQALKPTDFS